MGAAAGLLPLRESSEAIRQLRRNATGALEQVRKWLALLHCRLMRSVCVCGRALLHSRVLCSVRVGVGGLCNLVCEGRGAAALPIAVLCF